MTERESPNEFEQFWAGHSYLDDCLWERRPADVNPFGCLLAPVDIAMVVAEMHWQGKEEKEGFARLKTFLSTPRDMPIRVIKPGEVFEMSQFPKGTIVRYNKDFQRSSNFRNSDQNVWGIIIQERDYRGRFGRDQIIGVREDKVREWMRYGNGRAFMYDRSVNVGEVEHSRFREGLGGLTTYSNEGFSRYNSVEIWQYGQGVRQENRASVRRAVLRHQQAGI